MAANLSGLNRGGRPKGAATKRSAEIADKAARLGITPLEVLLKAMRKFDRAGDIEKAAFYAKDAAPYMHPRLAAVAVASTQSAEQRNVSMAELARRIAFIFREGAQEGKALEAIEYQEIKPDDVN